MPSAKTSKPKTSAKGTSVANERIKLIEQIKKVNNILITVSRNPSVDALSAALGLTAIIDKMEKHGTAIFSGKVPPAINFLNPDKIFEDTADSLRDFIIALSRDKADHLRYKLDGDVVKIFVTPYKTVITEKDLEFSQGDYNVELVIALGVDDQKDLDVALAAHGRILHDATVTTINIDEDVSNLGVINLQDKSASSLSEVVATIGESLSTKDKPLLDEQISTALMTGVVSMTDHFKNERTTPRSMEVAAMLMNAGADQQLISAQLDEVNSPDEEEDGENESQSKGEVSLADNSTSTANPDGSLTIDHSEKAGSSRLVISTLPPDEQELSESEEIRIPTATEILSQLAAESEEKDKSEKPIDTAPPQADTSEEKQTINSTRSYIVKDEEEATEDSLIISGHVSSEKSPSEGAEPLRETGSINKIIEPLNEIDTNAPVSQEPSQDFDDLPQFNVDQSAEAILQAALSSATPASEMGSPLPPPPPPPPPADFSSTPPPLPDFEELMPVQEAQPTPQPAPAPEVQEPLAPPVVSTLPPEDMILAGSKQQPESDSTTNDPTQFRIPGQ